MSFVFKHVVVMLDCPYGKGTTVGTVLPTDGVIVPAAVGLDIGCGMSAVRTPLTRDRIPDAQDIREHIERRFSDERRQEQREAHTDSGSAGRAARRARRRGTGQA
jgi:RNA-splicing ligase RtcB